MSLLIVLLTILNILNNNSCEYSEYSISIKNKEQVVLNGVNRYRRKHGLKNLKIAGSLCKYADYRVSNLINCECINHSNFGNHSISGFVSAGENLIRITVKDWRVIPKLWYRKYSHKENMLNSKWTHGCVSMKEYRGEYYTVLILGK